MDHNTPFGRDSPPDFIFDLEYFQQIFLQNSLLILHGLLMVDLTNYLLSLTPQDWSFGVTVSLRILF